MLKEKYSPLHPETRRYMERPHDGRSKVPYRNYGNPAQGWPEFTVQDPPEAANGVCGRWGWISNETGEVARFFCGSRTCRREECGKIFHWRRVRLLTDLVAEYALNYFFTLTLNPENVPKDTNAWNYIADPWRKVRTVTQRDHQGFRYVAILEKHKKNDRPHIHGFCNKFIPWEYWRDRWENCKGGNGVWLEEVIVSDNVAEYVSKGIEVCRYVGKDQVAGVPHHVRRTLWRSTKMMAKSELDKGTEWCILKADVYDSQGQQLKQYRLDKE